MGRPLLARLLLVLALGAAGPLRTARAATAADCPLLETKLALPKGILGGTEATLMVKVTNHGAAAVPDAGLGVTLPWGVVLKGMRVSPELPTARLTVDPYGGVAWTDLGLAPGKTYTFRITLRFEKCTPERIVMQVGTFTGRGPTQRCLQTTARKVSQGEGRWEGWIAINCLPHACLPPHPAAARAHCLGPRYPPTHPPLAQATVRRPEDAGECPVPEGTCAVPGRGG